MLRRINSRGPSGRRNRIPPGSGREPSMTPPRGWKHALRSCDGGERLIQPPRKQRCARYQRYLPPDNKNCPPPWRDKMSKR